MQLAICKQHVYPPFSPFNVNSFQLEVIGCRLRIHSFLVVAREVFKFSTYSYVYDEIELQRDVTFQPCNRPQVLSGRSTTDWKLRPVEISAII